VGVPRGYLASFVFPNRDPASRSLTLWGWLARRERLVFSAEFVVVA
jgi:hypothetical protein